jgi:hypothetical protein
MKYLLLAISLILSMNLNAQVTAKNHTIEADIDRDTLIVDGKVYLPKTSFIKFFDSYRNLFKNNEVWIGDVPQTKGYYVTWIVKKGVLYIDHIQLSNWSAYGGTKAEPKPHDIIKDPVSKSEIQHRLELLTGRKFNSYGLLKADWVNGSMKADANGHYVSFIDSSTYESDDHYIFTFEEGVLKSVEKI